MITLAALDIAGTVIDERNLVYQALVDCITERGIAVAPATLAKHQGTEKRTAIAAMLTESGADVTERLIDSCFDRFTALLHELYAATPPQAIPGAVDAIAAMREAGTKVVLTTGYNEDITALVLDYAGWSTGPDGTVDAVVCSDAVSQTRPAPYMIFRAMERVGTLNVKHVAVAGDTMADLQAGSNSGAAIVAGVLSGAADEATLRTQPHTHIMASVADLPAALADATA